MATTKVLQVKQKQKEIGPADQTRPAIVCRMNIFEDERQITVLTDIPGVTPGDVSIDLTGNVLNLAGDTKSMGEEDESTVLIQFEIGRHYRRFIFSEVVNHHRIKAELKDGALHLTLPKVDTSDPRRITVGKK